MHFTEKLSMLALNGVVRRIYMSSYAEIWSGDRFGSDINGVVIVAILIYFFFFQGVKVKYLVILTMFWTLTPWKIWKNLYFKIVAPLFCITFLSISWPNFSTIIFPQIPVTTPFYVNIDHFCYKVRFLLYFMISSLRKWS